MKKTTSGFTIVELLIVIVVIAILATISIVAYSGIQTRANNTQTIDAVKQFVKAYGLYAADNGDYPNATGCLGEGYLNNRCLAQNNTEQCWSLGGATSTAINTALKPYMNGKTASPSIQGVACGNTTYAGAYGAYITASKTVNIIMILRGDEICPPMSPNASAPVKLTGGDATRCAYTLASVSN